MLTLHTSGILNKLMITPNPTAQCHMYTLTTAQYPWHTPRITAVIFNEVMVAQRQSVFSAIAGHVCVQKVGVFCVRIMQPVFQCMPKAQLPTQYVAVAHCNCPVSVTHSMPACVEVVYHCAKVTWGTLMYELSLCSLCIYAW